MIGSTCVGSEGLDHNPGLHGLRRGEDEHRMCRSRGSTRQPDWSAGCLVSTNELSLILYHMRACASMRACIPFPDPHTYVYTHIRTCTHAQSYTHIHTQAYKHTHSHIHYHRHPHYTRYTYTTHTHIHHTHTHTHTPVSYTHLRAHETG